MPKKTPKKPKKSQDVDPPRADHGPGAAAADQPPFFYGSWHPHAGTGNHGRSLFDARARVVPPGRLPSDFPVRLGDLDHSYCPSSKIEREPSTFRVKGWTLVSFPGRTAAEKWSIFLLRGDLFGPDALDLIKAAFPTLWSRFDPSRGRAEATAEKPAAAPEECQSRPEAEVAGDKPWLPGNWSFSVDVKKVAEPTVVVLPNTTEKKMEAIANLAEATKELAKSLRSVSTEVSVSNCVFYGQGAKGPMLEIKTED